MPQNPWLAIDAATSPMVRAKQLRQAWEDFLCEGRLEGIRTPIAESWQRSYAAGVDPSGDHAAPALADADEAAARWHEHPLAAAAAVIRDCLAPIAVAAGHLVVVSDADGMLLWIDGPAGVRRAAADSMNFTEGAGWSESGPGTNAIGTALGAGHAVQVFAAEHFSEVVQEWTCAAAPVRDPDTGRLLGVIDVTGELGTVHPHSFGCAVATVQAVESHLRCLMHERDARLRARYEDRAGSGRALLVTPSGRILSAGDAVSAIGGQRLAVPPGGGELTLPSGVRAFAEPMGRGDALVVRPADQRTAARSRPLLKLTLLRRDQPHVELDGRPLQLSRCHTEILALLSDRPAGMTTEHLAAELYGDDGRPSAVWAHIFRMRKLLGPWIDAAPYRLSLDVESDVARVRGLLERGAVREAAEQYEDRLLPLSEAPGVVRERDALEAWLRQAVMTADDAEALWAWVRSASGHDDLAAWKRLLANLDYSDPRRSLAASRVGSLRAFLEASWGSA
ncbi:MAG TPA: hypothetical protein VK501_09295 [Baekduia sp.]|uniref:hypothetical protein n=1 Tax=Baekduia sp. TaxID=2600305 RepID=UPI002CCF1EC0|nr:hypothetical protein [Baekduia sp.]HMJ34101.1 hypothetical protein [Baekduia sp.]